MTTHDLIMGLGLAVCDVPAVRADGSCSCRLGAECPSSGKHPLGRKWLVSALARRARPTFRVPTTVRLAPATSYGLIPVPGSGVMVIDLDDPSVLPGLRMPETYTVRRASAPEGRGHYYLRVPDGLDELGVPRVFAGGEVRIAGSGHVVGPGCRHKSGDLYLGSGDAVATASEDLIAALWNLRPVRRDAEHGGREYVGEGERHAWLTGQARKMAGWGWDAERIEEGLRELNETMCQPPLAEGSMEPARMADWAVRNIPRDRRVSVRLGSGRGGARRGAGR
ncbi:MAG: bifunctional DNA primase/polymerase [Chloroflexota bacterium]